jgi:PmbA protein
MIDDLLTLAADAVSRARKLGATSADAIAADRRAASISIREGVTEELESSEAREVGLRVFTGKAFATISGSVLDGAGLDRLAEMAVAMARAAPDDEDAGLADVSLLTGSVPELDLISATLPNADALKRMALDAEAAAKSVAGVAKSGGAGASRSDRAIALATSTGFARGYRRTGVSFSVSAIAGVGTGMERDYDYSSATHYSDLKSPEEIGLGAGGRAVRRFNPRKVKSQSVPVVYDPRVASSIVGHFLSAVSGDSSVRGTSFLREKMNAQVLSRGITIIDDPLRLRGLASRPFDAEGLASAALALADDGVLMNWILDLRSARKLRLASNGRASRGLSSAPGPSSTNVYMKAGCSDPKSLIGGISNGLYVTELIGMGVNMVTGDYSRGASGFWIENGELAFPVSEITIAGNLKDMFLHLTPASDLVFKSSTSAPTLLVEGLTIAGT